MDVLQRCKTDYPPLSKEEEIELAKAIEKGDEKARETLILSNIGFVKTLANRYSKLGADYDDLVQEGFLGLLKATEKYDWRKNCTFLTYASWWVKSRMKRYLEQYKNIISIPINVIECVEKISRVREQIERTENRTPVIQEISAITNIPEKKIKEYETAYKTVIRLESPCVNGEGTVMDTIEDGDWSVEEQVLKREFPGLMEEIMEVVKEWCEQKNKLSFNEVFEIISRHYGLNGRTYETTEAIGMELNMSKKDVIETEKKIMRYIRSNPKIKSIVRKYDIEGL